MRKKVGRETQVVIRFLDYYNYAGSFGSDDFKITLRKHDTKSRQLPAFFMADEITAMVLEKVMNLLMCPVCREALSLTEKTWRCSGNHSYDMAKQGYVNLHVVQHKHSKNPGDTRVRSGTPHIPFRWFLCTLTTGGS